MPKVHTRIKAKVIEHVTKYRQNKKPISGAALFMIIALTAALGYMAGTNNYQITAALGPVFGYKAHAAIIDLTSVQETYSQLASHFDGGLDMNLLIQGANRGMVAAAGDKYTIYFSPSEAVDFNNNLSGNIGGGIGAQVGIKNDKVIIVRPLKDNPAIKAGLLANDIVLSVNDQSVAGWSVDKVVSMIRGESGTTVKMQIQRGTEIKTFTITREIINNPSVDSSIEGKMGIMTISRFDSETGNLALAAAQNFVRQGVKEVILDLRDNGGGYVSGAVDVAGLWLDNQVIVTERTGGTVKDTLKSGSNALLAGLPTVVLVNGNTASASEIVAGALQDHKAAQLVGQRTFGKGSVQLPISLSGGDEIKVTVAKWYTPDGKNINQQGITPTVITDLTQANVDKGVDPQMDAAKKQLGL